MADIAGSSWRRALRLAGVPTAHAARAAAGLGRRMVGGPAEQIAAEVQERTALQLFGVLGELKGGAMKLGQAMSAMEAALPAELAAPYRETLTRLQEAAPPMPASAVHGVLRSSFGDCWRDRFERFDDRAAAAASLGQVHRAVWHDGREVAVKVQYPGVAEAMAADLRQLDRLAPAMRLGAPGIDARSLIGELRDRLGEELDYRAEAQAQTDFVEGLGADGDFVVPAVVDVGEGVLVSDWVGGTPLAEVIADGSMSRRDRAGELLVRLLLSAPSLVGRIHGDPHPGNFRLDEQGRLVVLDFGSTERMPTGWPPALGALLAAGRERDAETLHDLAVSTALLREGDVVPAELLAVLDAWFEPLRVDRFHFSRPWLRAEVKEFSRPGTRASRLQRRLRVPTRHLLVQRVAFGLVGVLTSLDATVAVRSQVERWLPVPDPPR